MEDENTNVKTNCAVGNVIKFIPYNKHNFGEQYHNTINDLYTWEAQIKDQEKEINENITTSEQLHSTKIRKPKQQINMNFFPTKSQNNKIESVYCFDDHSSSTSSLQEIRSTMESSKTVANTLKNKGNNHVGLGEYKKAITFYTEAISIYKSDPVFYANRALCHLKLENYNECIKDCNQAIKLDSNYTKAYYRLMRAYESLGDIKNAFKNCKILIEIEPTDHALASYEKMKKKLRLKEFNKVQLSSKQAQLSQNFKSLPKDVIEVATIDKPPRLRSRTALKQINIVEIIGKPPTKRSNVEKLGHKKSNSDNVSTNQSLVKSAGKKSVATTSNISESNIKKKVITNLVPPKKASEFYVTWKDLTKDQKYLYLKLIEPSNINKILGAVFNYDRLSEIIKILSDYYVKDGEKIGKLLCNIANHNEVKILAFFLSKSDRKRLSELIDYMQKQNDETDYIENIKSKFNM